MNIKCRLIFPGLHTHEVTNVNILESELSENSRRRNTLVVITFWCSVYFSDHIQCLSRCLSIFRAGSSDGETILIR